MKKKGFLFWTGLVLIGVFLFYNAVKPLWTDITSIYGTLVPSVVEQEE